MRSEDGRWDRAIDIASGAQLAAAVIAVPVLLILGNWFEIPRWIWWVLVVVVGWSFVLMFAMVGVQKIALLVTVFMDLGKSLGRGIRRLF